MKICYDEKEEKKQQTKNQTNKQSKYFVSFFSNTSMKICQDEKKNKNQQKTDITYETKFKDTKEITKIRRSVCRCM